MAMMSSVTIDRVKADWTMDVLAVYGTSPNKIADEYLADGAFVFIVQRGNEDAFAVARDNPNMTSVLLSRDTVLIGAGYVIEHVYDKCLIVWRSKE